MAKTRDREKKVAAPVELSRRYIDRHNDGNLDGLLELVGEDIDFKRAGDPPLRGAAAVRRQYELDWKDHQQVVVTPLRAYERGRAAAIEIHVESGPPTNVMYDGVVVHDWDDTDRLIRYRLYIDEVVPASDASA
ncbi:MAG TPA: nuclear transport factor 2 family protein [Acidimicrobiales bacterium]|nr:nuclear transport factor 2 family protein [Acidimicrobiales bacterium]